jgi:uncharacterized protein YjdB
MHVRSVTMLAFIICAALFVSACGSSTSPTATTSITVTGMPPTVGASSQLTATAMLSDGETEDITSTATWLSSNPSVATVSASGVVTGVSAGTASIDATVGSVTGALQLVVADPS